MHSEIEAVVDRRSIFSSPVNDQMEVVKELILISIHLLVLGGLFRDIIQAQSLFFWLTAKTTPSLNYKYEN